MNETSPESMESSNQIKPTDETLKIFSDIKLILDFNDFLVKDQRFHFIIINLLLLIKNESYTFLILLKMWWMNFSRNITNEHDGPLQETSSEWQKFLRWHLLDWTFLTEKYWIHLLFLFVFSSISFLSSSFTFCSIFPHPYRLSWSWSLSLLIAGKVFLSTQANKYWRQMWKICADRDSLVTQ